MFDDDPLLRAASPAAIAFVIGAYAILLVAGTAVALALAFRLARRAAPWAQRTHELVARSLTWLEGGQVVLGLLGLVVLTILLVTGLRRHSEGMLLVLQSVTVDLAGLGCVALVLRRRSLTWRATFGLRWRRPEPGAAALDDPHEPAGGNPLAFGAALGRGALAYVALVPFIVFASFVSQGILSARGYPPSIQDVARLLTADHPTWLRVYLLFLAVGLAPLFEETVFRGVLLPLLARRFGLGAGVLIASAVFAGIHMHLYSTAPLFVFAVGLSLAYVYTGSLWVPIAMHALFNGINLLFLLVLAGASNQ